MPRDDDDDRPRNRRPRDDEDDDRPRKRKVRDEDEDDDRPRARRKPRDDDEDDDRLRSRRRERDEDDYDDRPRKKKRKKKPPQQSVLGGVALSTGILGLVMSFACGAIGLAPAVIGLGLGIVALIIAQKSEGRQSPILPLAGSAVSLVATGISIFFLVSFIREVKEIRDEIKQDIEQYEREDAEWMKEQVQATADVKAARAGDVTKFTALQFHQAVRNDDGRFERQYSNKVIEITGGFDGLNLAGNPYHVFIRAVDPEEPVQCHFVANSKLRARLTSLKAGEMVTIRGKYMGRGTAIEGCVLVSPGAGSGD